MDAFLRKHSIILWFGILIITLSLIFNNIWGKTACERYDDHSAYWDRYGYDGDPIKTLWLRTACDKEDPCLQLQRHDLHWAARGGDKDPARRMILNASCHGTAQATKDVVDAMVLTGSNAYKTLKKMSLEAVYAISFPIREQLKADFYAHEQDPHRFDVAHVRVGDDPVSAQEHEHRRARLATVKRAQETFLGMALADDEVLDVAFSLSGGGIRAALCGLGSLVGSQKIGLLDCVMTITSLSGGTWILFPWIASGLDILTYREKYLSIWQNGYVAPTPAQARAMVQDIFLAPFAFEKDVTITDVYNAGLSQMLLAQMPNPQRVTLSSLAHKSQYPVPVGEAVWADLAGDSWDEEIFEFTPYEVGNRHWLKSYIPSWGLGRKYFNGVSSNTAPETSLPLGVFGSAYAVSGATLGTILLKYVPTFLHGPLAKIMDTRLGELRTGVGIVHNYTQGMPSSPLKDQPDILLADAGAGTVVQIMPLVSAYRSDAVGHKPDVLFLFDCGASKPTVELKKLELFAQKLKLPLPRISGAGHKFNEIVTVFEDKTPEGTLDLTKPVVMYMPRVADPKVLESYRGKPGYGIYAHYLQKFDMDACIDEGGCGTFNFKWPRNRAEQVATMTEFNVVAMAETIKETMRSVVIAKRAQKEA